MVKWDNDEMVMASAAMKKIVLGVIYGDEEEERVTSIAGNNT